ncbi:MAG: hypothetical protein JNK64_31215 [Myxococcales bacterium]|nr:hypothetical protein [Myxococcales bacterium]
MAEPERVRRAAVDLQAAVVGRAVVGVAQRGEARGGVVAAARAWHEVVDVDVTRVAAARHDAAPAVAPQHGPPGPGRDRARRPRRAIAVDASEQLGVARRLGQLGLADLDRPPVGVLPGVAAVVAGGDDDLVRRAVVGGIVRSRAREIAPAPLGDALLVGERVAARGLADPPRLGEQRERGRRQEEPDLVEARRGVGRVVRVIAAVPAADHRLDVAHGVVGGRLEPRGLGVGGGDARELADGAVRDVASVHRRAQLRQDGQRVGDPEPLARRTGGIAEDALDVLGERAVAEVPMHARAARAPQPRGLLDVERGAPPREVPQRPVHDLPLGLAGRRAVGARRRRRRVCLASPLAHPRLPL